MSLVRLFRRKRPPPLVCSVALDDHGHPLADDPAHVHTAACFVEFASLALIELFQSQGCVSCPAAVPAIQTAAAQPNRLLLTYNISVFDHTGWKDTLARAAWDQRQRAYLRRWQRTSLFTPQVVVNGAVDTSAGSDLDGAVSQARSAIQAAMPWHIVLDANDEAVRIDSDAPSTVPVVGVATEMTPDDFAASIPPYDIWLAVYQGGDQTVKIGKGPNKGKKLLHRHVVTQLVKLGEWRGGDLTVALPSARSAMAPGLEAVVFLQAGPGGPIVAAAQV